MDLSRTAQNCNCKRRLRASRLVPGLVALPRVVTAGVFQDKTVVQILESVFADYADGLAAWQWSDELPVFTDARPRSYCAIW